MKQTIHKIVSLLMATVVLFSTMSFTIDMHYCGDVLVDTAVFSEAQSCGMESMDDSSCTTPNLKKKCCSEKKISFEGKKNLQTSFDNLSFDQQVFIASYIYTYSNLFEVSEDNSTSFLDYSPPNFVKDIQLLDEVFLI